jgi:hypothetical protein
VEEQVWHLEQNMEHGPDCSLMLKFPVADLREVRSEVHKLGSQAEMVSSPELWDRAREEIEKNEKALHIGHYMGGVAC